MCVCVCIYIYMYVCIYIYICTHTHIQVSLVESQNLTHWEVLGDRMTVLPLVSLPSILPLPVLQEKFGTCLKNVISVFFLH